MKRLLKRWLFFFYSMVRKDVGPKIIFYHDIGTQYTKMGTDESIFKAHVEAALSRGFEYVDSLDALLKGGDKKLLICFDDGFRGVWDQREYFKRMGIRPLVFVPVALIGQAGHLTWEEIKALQKLGFIFEGHTWSHQTLSGEFIEEAPREDRTDDWYERELKSSKMELERRLGAEVSSICFPAGHFSPRVMSLCDRYGYRYLFTSVPGSVPMRLPNAENEPWMERIMLLPRHLCQNLTRSEFVWVLNGAMAPLASRYLSQHWSAI